jgi:mono/diheme cytochrome c family protein
MKSSALRSATQAGLSALLPALFAALAPAHAAETVSNAEQLYQTHCAACHGSAMQGRHRPDAGCAQMAARCADQGQSGQGDYARGAGKNICPRGGKTLSAAQIEQLAGYIAANANKPAVVSKVASVAAPAAAAATTPATAAAIAAAKASRISLP